MGTTRGWLSSLLPATLVATPLLTAQIAGDAADAMGRGPAGFRVESISAFGTYYSGPAATQQTLSAGTLWAASGTGLSATLGYDRVSERTTISAIYTPAFIFEFENSGRIQNHALSLNVRRSLTPKWTVTIGATGVESRVTEALFLPTPASLALSNSTPFSQVSSLPTYSTSSLATQISNFFYGNRMLDVGMQSGVTYSHSSRVSVHATLNGSRLEALPDSTGAVYRAGRVLTNSTVVAFSSGVSYSISPRTEISTDWSSSRTFSNLQDYYTHTAELSVRRTMSPRWFVDLHLGGGFVQPVRESISLSSGPRYQAVGGLGYKSHAHTFVASVDRSVTDTYGFGASSSLSSTGAWTWHHPGSSWSVNANVGQQWLPGSIYGNATVWRGTAGLVRVVGRHTVMTTQYAYLGQSQVSGHSYLPGAQQVIQLVFGWIPIIPSSRY